MDPVEHGDHGVTHTQAIPKSPQNNTKVWVIALPDPKQPNTIKDSFVAQSPMQLPYDGYS